MINKIMAQINNYFYKTVNGVKQYDNVELTFTNSTSKIAGSFDLTYKVGMYIRVCGSDLNDNVYKITAIDTDEITIDGTLVDEVDTACIYQLVPPSDFIELVTEITTYNTDNSGSEGVTSLSLGDLSKSYGTDSNWQSVYQTRLNTYRKLRW